MSSGKSWLIRLSLLVPIGVGLTLSGGCSDSASGFALPPGDPERGKEVFVELRCNACHGISGQVERSKTDYHESIYVELGGNVTRVKTYGDLVTSIINPSHRFARGRDPRNVDEQGESNMRRYNEEMTVEQLIDLTAFLSSQYSVWSPHYVAYRHM